MSLILSGTDGLSDIDGSAATPAIRGTDANTGIFFPAADTIAFSEGGVEAARFDSSGNFGIGTSLPTTKLDVLGSGDGEVRIRAGSDAALIFSETTANKNWKLKPSAGDFFWQYSATAYNSGYSALMALTSSGNLGIGTTSPSTSNTAGASFVPGTSTVASMTGSNGSGQLLLGNNGNGSNLATNDSCGMIAFKGRFNSTFGGGNDIASIIGTYTGNGTTRSGAIRFLTLNNGTEAEAARFDSSGKLLVGTTSSFASANLQIKPSSGNAAIAAQVLTNGNNCVNWYNESGAFVAAIVVNSGTINYNTVSDYRLKENIIPMTNALDKVAALKPCTYTWKDSGDTGQGFIAHELQEVVPDAVSGQKDALHEDGTPKLQGVDTSFVVATLTAAIQEQQALITQLTARITALEGA